jgi:anti-sigma regulatory factor (Ser/Thr protein kinase)
VEGGAQMQIRDDEGTYWRGSMGGAAEFSELRVGGGPREEPVAGVWRAALPAVDASVPRARHMVRDLLVAQGLGGPAHTELLYSLLLIVSELVTNAVRHAAVLSPQIVVEVVIGEGWVRVSVEDSHPYRPSALQNDFGRTGGRGLLLVRAMALESGGGCDVERTIGGGKVVWASLPVGKAGSPFPDPMTP